ncbi:MAG: enoyl-CoA hydratase/isomerase family protein, partial [Bacteroidetes bacterium]|nr:enoyl-CoA hydratase/isomerase family protein [Bacteroidota bacterium]
MALSIDAANWRSSNWAVQQGLFAEQHETVENLDTAVNTLAGTLAKSSTQAMAALKKIYWQDAENWDNLLLERAAISGTLVLSD